MLKTAVIQSRILRVIVTSFTRCVPCSGIIGGSMRPRRRTGIAPAGNLLQKKSPGERSPASGNSIQHAPGSGSPVMGGPSPRQPSPGAIMGRVAAGVAVEQAEPEFAQRVRALFDARRHKTIATLRTDGSPRISGIEAVFEDGELVFGSMPNARKGADLRRDPRFALHSATVDPVEGSEAQWPGEAKIS